MLNVFNLIGTSDGNRAKVVWNNGNPAQLQIVLEGTNSLVLLMNDANVNIIPVTFGGRHPKTVTLGSADVIVNSVCDPDTNTKTLLQIEQSLSNSTIPVINPPELIFGTTREKIYERLGGVDGVRVPKTLRIAPRRLSEIPQMIADGGLAYPYIFRSAGEHGGGGMVLVESEKDLPALERFAFDGRDFYAIAFHDFRDNDGLYRKYRLVVIDGKLYPRHLIASSSWNIHTESRRELVSSDPALQNEEKAFHENPPAFLHETVAKIHEKLPLDFFGIDCHITPENELFIFELNTCMRVVADNPTGYHVPPTERIKGAFVRLLETKSAKK
jgi:hypothetical protein